jgi:hypothetical protein
VIEIANVDETAGAIHNEDLWISPEGRAYVMYTEQEVASAVVRDRFFPGCSTLSSLRLAVVYDGKILARYVLLKETEGQSVSCARFHETKNGKVYAVLHINGHEPPNTMLPIYPQLEPEKLIPIPLEKPLTRFCVASVRAGNVPADILDLHGYGADIHTMRYAAVRIASSSP